MKEKGNIEVEKYGRKGAWQEEGNTEEKREGREECRRRDGRKKVEGK